MRKTLGALAALALAAGGVTLTAPAVDAAPNRAWYAAHPCKGLHGKQAKRCVNRVNAKRAEVRTRVATRPEYLRLREGMTLEQVRALFRAPMRLKAHYFEAVLINGDEVRHDGRQDWVVWTGRDKYDGRSCWALKLEFYDRLGEAGVFRLASWENQSNTCTSIFFN